MYQTILTCSVKAQQWSVQVGKNWLMGSEIYNANPKCWDKMTTKFMDLLLIGLIS